MLHLIFYYSIQIPPSSGQISSPEQWPLLQLLLPWLPSIHARLSEWVLSYLHICMPDNKYWVWTRTCNFYEILCSLMHTWYKTCSFPQEPTSTLSNCRQAMDGAIINMPFLWMIVAGVFIALAILSTIISIVLGAVICHSRKSSKPNRQGMNINTEPIYYIKYRCALSRPWSTYLYCISMVLV